tara:strand:+ start:186 stop:911 length:726 start_codon:yes stop_codon:yes gene_type:complete
MLDLTKNKIALSLSIVIHFFVIVFFAIKNISNKPTTSMTVVNLVENIPSKKLYDIDKNIDVDVKENKLFNANQNNKNLTKLNNKSFSQNDHTNNRTFERKLVDDKKIKNSFSQKKQLLDHSERQKNKRYEEELSLRKKSYNSIPENSKSSAKYKIGTIQNPHPEYPMIARKKGWQGRLLLNVHVSKDGNVINLNVVKTSGFEILDKISVKTIRDWKFTPARIGGKNVEDSLNIPVSFRLIN